jgi:acetolactate synthase-1/2/3 large subunit
VPAARKAFEGLDTLVAIGCRFGELATGSYGMEVPANLVHADINPKVFHANYPAKIAVESDARVFAEALVAALRANGTTPRDRAALVATIAKEKAAFTASWTEKTNDERVSPGIFFRELRKKLARDAYVILDDGNHTFLAAEQYPVYESKHMFSPTDFNCMGYCVPATIATKLAHPDKQVCGIVGDGGFLMTAMEILTAAVNELGVVFFVFHDGELGQISQFQHIPLKYKTCTVLGDVRFEGVATATGAAYLRMQNDHDVSRAIDEALAIAEKGAPVLVDVNIDYSRRSAFTSGVVKTSLGRFPIAQKLRFVGRALKRHTIG